MKRVTGLLFLLWAGAILALYYVVQKPGLLNAFTGLLDTFWTLLTAIILLLNAFGIGWRSLRLFKFETDDLIDHLLLSWGIGLGLLGLLGLLFSVAQLADAAILSTVQIALAIFFLLRNDQVRLRAGIRSLVLKLMFAFSQYDIFTKLILATLLFLTCVLTLAPPYEAFDALFYHLTQPARVIQNGGLQALEAAPQFWFPNLTENVYLWVLGMGSERATQVIHFSWAVLSALLVWHWAGKTWSSEIARRGLLLLAAMPALPLLASWAYADMALVYYSIAALYALTQFRDTKVNQWIPLIALMAGFAMSVKYTSFMVPLTGGLLLLLQRPFHRSILHTAQFSALAVVTALPYYLRNAVFMQNPFYPFLFGGRYWDDFRAAWYADSGTGIGWNAVQLFRLPFDTLLGYRDANFFDGRMGPLFLILAPFTIWILLRHTRRDSAEDWTLFTIGVYSLLSFAAWTVGVINSSALWQARLLFPMLVPFAIPTALAWDSLKRFDTPRLRISFLANIIVAAVLALTVFDLGLFVLQRNPLAVALGAQSRERYIERVNPSYAALMDILDEFPEDVRIYSLFEPRTYGLPRATQPDPILDNFAHAVHVHQTPEAILRHWKAEQFTHILVYERGLEFMIGSELEKFPPPAQNLLNETLDQLVLVAQTPDDVYSIYEVP